MSRYVVAVAVFVVLAGCDKPETAMDPPVASQGLTIETQVNETTGAIAGVTLNVEKSPLAEVTLALGEGAAARTTTSGPAGEFVFNDLEPGAHKLFAQKLGFKSVATKVDVTVGEVSKVTLELAQIVTGPAFPIEARLFGFESTGGWFQVPYAQVQPFLPEGFTAKPHVLAETNEQTAELAFYVSKYVNGTIDGTALDTGYWSFAVISVTPSNQHSGSGATVQFVPIASHASDPRLAILLSTWGIATNQGTLTFTRTSGADQAHNVVADLKSDSGAFTLTAASAAEESALTSGSLSVRMFRVKDKVVGSYVDLDISRVLYSITGGARLDQASGFPIMPQAVVGEAYVQWGAQASQVMRFEPAEPSAG